MINIKNTKQPFGELLEALNLKGFGVEIGVNKGNHAQVIVDTTPLSKIYLVDCWECTEENNSYGDQKAQEDVYSFVLNRFKGNNRVEILKKYSVDAANTFPDKHFDFVYIDANHDYEFVKQDIEAWYPKVKIGGIFSGHDYSKNRSKAGVVKAVDEFCKEFDKKLYLSTDRCPSWYIFN